MRGLFSPSDKYDGIRPVNIYLMRLIFALMCFVMGKDVWSFIFSHSGTWNENEAIAWSVWAGFSVMALLGLFRTVAMIPVLILEIIYKVIWLTLYAWPLIRDGRLEGSATCRPAPGRRPSARGRRAPARLPLPRA